MDDVRFSGILGTTPVVGGGRVYVPPHPPTSAAGTRTTESPQQQRIRDAAGKLVAQTFYGPMLRMMRESPFKSELFSGGRGGEAFSMLLDQQLVSRMARRHDPLVDAIVRRLSGPQGSPATARFAAAEVMA